jgi:hypothetical protein
MNVERLTICVGGRLRIQAGCTRAAAGQPHEVERLIFALEGRLRGI